jgi:hypothetical protein
LIFFFAFPVAILSFLKKEYFKLLQQREYNEGTPAGRVPESLFLFWVVGGFRMPSDFQINRREMIPPMPM